MFKLSVKGALICAVLPMSLLASGSAFASHSDGVGYDGAMAEVHGNWNAARSNFDKDFQKDPDHPIAVFNEGYALGHDGDADQGNTLLHEAVIKGKGYVPDGNTEPPGSGVTIADFACSRLHRAHQLDPNCGDQIAVITAPAPVAEAAPEPAPAPEAEATVAPKQDRN